MPLIPAINEPEENNEEIVNNEKNEEKPKEEELVSIEGLLLRSIENPIPKPNCSDDLLAFPNDNLSPMTQRRRSVKLQRKTSEEFSKLKSAVEYFEATINETVGDFDTNKKMQLQMMLKHAIAKIDQL